MKLFCLFTTVLCVCALLVGCGVSAVQSDNGNANGNVDAPSSSVSTTTTTASSVAENQPTDGNVTADEAKAAALKDAGVSQSDIFDFEIELDREGTKTVYDISFETQTAEFDYEIDAANGKVVRARKEPRPSASENTKPSSKVTTKKTTTTAKATTTTAKPTGGWLTADEAKAVAIKHAGVKEADVFDLDVELDNDSGVPTYEIDFETDEYEYTYYVFAESGKVNKAFRTKQDDQRLTNTTTATTTQAGKELLSKSEAKSIALKTVGIKEAGTFDWEIELDRERVNVVYEVSFDTESYEYNLEISAYSGEVIKAEKEPRD